MPTCAVKRPTTSHSRHPHADQLRVTNWLALPADDNLACIAFGALKVVELTELGKRPIEHNGTRTDFVCECLRDKQNGLQECALPTTVGTSKYRQGSDRQLRLLTD